MRAAPPGSIGPVQAARMRPKENVMDLADNACVPCRGGVPPLGDDRVDALLAELGDDWQLNDSGHLERAYEFADFMSALDFANAVGDIAEREGHHPDLHVRWGECRVEIWTHKIDGLTESDFYLAAKISRARDA
jgi:4a-hydroxytetrahydrobiopterin dehydratase